MNAHLQRAQMLLAQGRNELAEKELRQSLAQEPNNPAAHAMLAACLCDSGKLVEATDAAGQAIHLAPDISYGHYVLGHVMYHRNRLKEAREAVDTAIRLDPSDAEAFALLAAIEHDQKRWKETLSAAERGLEAEPDHVRCANLRAMALTNLGRRQEAGQTIDTALRHDPDNAFTHANQGWTLLNQGRPKDAMTHFREALRLEPDLEWARAGIIEAMKARNFIYRWLLAWFLLLARFSTRVQILLVLGIVFGQRLVVDAAKGTPLEPMIPFLFFGYLGFVWMTWCGSTLFNLLLRFDRFGRLALSPKEHKQANVVAVYLLIGIGVVIADAALGFVYLSIFAAPFALILIPLNGVFAARNKTAFWIMSLVTAVLTWKACTAIFLIFARQPEAAAEALKFSITGCLYSTWASLFLAVQSRPKI